MSKNQGAFGKLYVGKNGIAGAINEELIGVGKEDKKELILSALKFTEQFGKKNNCKVLTSWCNKNHFYSKYYDHFKMNLSSILRYCLIFSNNEKFKDLKISEKWYLSQGDSDVY